LPTKEVGRGLHFLLLRESGEEGGCVNKTSSRRKKASPGLGSSGRIVAGLLAAAVVVAGIGWFSLSGRLASLQYTNVPVLHPYPPAGYFVNPYTGDPRDLLNSAEASRVKADLLRDGQLQVDALAQGSATVLSQTATGNYLAKLDETVATNNAQGVVYREQHQVDSMTVGRLGDPNSPTFITWCVEESGSGAATYVNKLSGQSVSAYRFRFRNRFWLARVGDRYLVADAAISSTRES
jgi:hypothetical protein